nr:hypothetical protein Q903MT_gene6053 [Picea sitchensis]
MFFLPDRTKSAVFHLYVCPPDQSINHPITYIIAATYFLSRWSRVRCLTLSLQSSVLSHPLPLVESSLPHPLLTVERAFASSPVGRACLRILGE